MGALIPPSDDHGLGEGYHSPQVPVAVRLNANESPFPPPAGFVDALAAEVARVEFHRYPDRGAAALRAALADLHGVATQQVFAANTWSGATPCWSASARRSPTAPRSG